MSEIFGYDLDKSFYYENGYYLTSNMKRIPKMLAHYELYKKITNLPGEVVEFGVFKGTSFVRFTTFRNTLESEFSRKVIGFDMFGEFPKQGDKNDLEFIKKFENAAGSGISKSELEKALENKKIRNFELIQGDINETLPKYLEENPHLKIALLHIDVDIAPPTKTILDNLADRVVRGGLIVLDDYGTVAGETIEVDKFLADNPNYKINKLSISHIPSFIEKI